MENSKSVIFDENGLIRDDLMSKYDYDPVNRPEHYAGSKIETIDYIEDKQLGFCLGNVIKYVSRAGKKRSNGKTDLEKEIEDLEKAKWYLERRIFELKNGVNV